MRSIVILASGNGTNFQAIVDAIEDGRIHAGIKLLLSDRKDAYVLSRARTRNIPFKIVTYRKSDPDFLNSTIENTIRAISPDLVVLAGFNRILNDSTVKEFRTINIHPSLLPCFGGKGFYGMKVHESVIASGAKFSGCTVHFVTGEIDGGPIILQRIVSVLDSDTPESLAERIHHEEHVAIVDAINTVLESNYRISGKRVLRP
ncbi:phosphoribosylglycinamide formyltransferase [Thermoplasmatales archaeon]|nr:phosphoribosylglycinamide formyltransferase [Thermoplasmatales archaeon]